MRHGYLITAIAMLGVTTQAKAEILALDCNMNGRPYNVWIDMDKSFATVQGNEGEGSHPAQITPTSITWTLNYTGYSTEVTIDRTAGTMRWHILPNASGATMDRTDSCARGSTPFPATKF